MKRSDFSEHAPGQLVPADEGAVAFVPTPLPPRLEFTSELVNTLSAADRALGELAGVGRALGEHANPYLLIHPFVRREAVLSSRIEGTQATVTDVFLFPVAPKQARHGDVLEVVNYVRAHEHGLRSHLPVCARLLREMHEILMRGVRGGDREPGEFRRRQNWIGAEGSTIHEARFVPPPPTALSDAIGALETYVHDAGSVPPLVKLALVHYQFEAIHPFTDGNGRIGRMLISLMMCRERLLPLPLLYLSAFFEANREEYARRLYETSTRGRWDEWMRFFLRGVAEQGADSIARANRMFELRAEWGRRCQTARSSALLVRLVDHLFVQPVVTSHEVMELLAISRPAALKNLERLASLNILSKVESSGRGVWVASEVLRLAERDLRPRSEPPA